VRPQHASILIVTAICGCSLSNTAIAPGDEMDASVDDSSTGDGRPTDVGSDAPPSDTSTSDTSMDSRVGDSGPSDTSTSDTAADTRRDAGGPRCDAADRGLVACYLFEDDLADGSFYANPASGSGYGFAGGVAGRGLEVNATSAVTAPHHAETDAPEVTLEVWARLDRIPGSGRMALAEKSDQYGLFVYPDGSVLFGMGFEAGREDAWSSAGAIVAARWYHFAGTYDGSTQRVYVDGTEVGSNRPAGTVSLDSGRLFIGAEGPSGGDRLEGRLDNLRMYSYARSAAQIRASASALSIAP